MAKSARWSILVALGLLAAGLWRIERASRATAPGSAQAPSLPPDRPSPIANPPPPGIQPPPLSSAAQAVSLTTEAPFDEATLMVRLRSVKDTDPALCTNLAREGNRRFPETPDAPERASILIHSLARQGLASEARGEAEDMVNAYPDSSWVREIEQFTGAHRHRNIRFSHDGGIELY
jgi:hypothetical protein